MEYDRAVRLRELWNGNFHLNLTVKKGLSYDYILHGVNSETSVESMAVLKRLAEKLHLELKARSTFYTIT